LGLGPEKLRREIQLQAKLSHVNIVELKQVGTLGSPGQPPYNSVHLVWGCRLCGFCVGRTCL
jgi:hypothetical protein